MVTQEQLKKLADPMPYKYRIQSVKYGKATVVSYVDARNVYDRLDEVCGVGNWKNDFEFIDGKLFCQLSILVERDLDKGEWVGKCDTGTENQMEKEKSQVSDALKRSAVLWGIGRFLYSLGVITLNVKEHTNKKEYPCTSDGRILWSNEDLTEYCKKLAEQGILDDTKPKAAAKRTDDSNPNQKKVSTTKRQEPTKQDTNNEEAQRKGKALVAFKKYMVDKGLEGVEETKFVVKTLKSATIEDFIKNNTLEVILDKYNELTK